MSQIRRQSDPPLGQKVKKRLKKMVSQASYASPFYEFRLKGKHPLRLLGTPIDPWSGSVAAGSHILSHRFYCDGRVLRNPDNQAGEWRGGEIWQAEGLDQNWRQHLHAFSWLRDLNRGVDRTAARIKAQTLTHHWLENFDQWQELAWSPDTIGRRIVYWMTYAPLILDTNDLVYRSKLLNSLARQARHLYHAGDDQLRGLPRMRAIGGLIMAGLYIPHGDAWLQKGNSLLIQALSQEIMADGGVASRNPEDLHRILRNLLRVRAAYKTRNHPIPDKLSDAINRMVPQLKNLLLGDGRLALFNGSSGQNAQDIAATFSFCRDFDTESEGESSGESSGLVDERSGFRQLHQGSTVVIVDTGPPADVEVSQNSHAGTLSFEMSHGKQRMIVNCGSANALTDLSERERFKLTRSTAAHSTLVLNDKNSSQIRKDGLIGRGPSVVSCQRTAEKGHNLLDTSHDGYLARFGIIHHRSIYMNDLGDDVRGEDILDRKRPDISAPKFDVRFHIHPDITLTLQKKTGSVLLRLPGLENWAESDYWQFQCSGGNLTLEESLYLGDGARPQNCRQIVLSGTAKDKKTVIKWSLYRIEHGPR